MILGIGHNSCGKWSEQSKRDDAGILVYRSWVTGYLTGFGDGMHGPDNQATIDMSRGFDIEALLAWIDTYCAAHPLDNVLTAARSLVIELDRRKSR